MTLPGQPSPTEPIARAIHSRLESLCPEIRSLIDTADRNPRHSEVEWQRILVHLRILVQDAEAISNYFGSLRADRVDEMLYPPDP